MTTFAEHKSRESSNKITLARVQASKELVGWVLDSGVVFSTSFNESIIVSIKDSGTTYTSVANKASIVASTYFYDREAGTIFLQASDSSDPNTRFLVVLFSLFFSDSSVILPNDLSTGFDVLWLPLIPAGGTSSFGVKLDRQNQAGVAIEGSGALTLRNDKSFWQPRFDKFTFENKLVEIFTWSKDLDVSAARQIFKGNIQGKSYSMTSVRFTIKDLFHQLRAPLDLDNLSLVGGTVIPESLDDAKQRQVYGFLNGFRPTNIDQVLETGIPMTGTVVTTTASTTVTGTGTSFLLEVMQGDQLDIVGIAANLTVESVTSATVLVLTEDAGSAVSGAALTVIPDRTKRRSNRDWLIAGHALREPSTTVDNTLSSNTFGVADITDLEAGDQITVGAETVTILRVGPSRTVKLTGNLLTPPTIGTTVVKPPITNVFINEQELNLTRDYTVDASGSKITLTETAERNVAPTRTLNGTVSFSSGTLTITGSSTNFTSQLRPGDSLRASTEEAFVEVSSIQSDTELRLTAVSPYTAASATALFRTPKIFDNSEDVLSCDIVGGATEDETTSGTFIRTGPQIVEDLIKKAGLTSFLETTSFDTAKDIAQEKVGLAIPSTFDGKTVPKIRKLIDEVNKTVLGSLIQDTDFKFAYNVIDPGRAVVDLVSFEERDMLKWAIKAKSDKIVKNVKVVFDNKEYERTTQEAGSTFELQESKEGKFLAESTKDFEQKTLLRDQSSAQTLAQRLAFIFASSTTIFTFTTKLQGIDLDINDHVRVSNRFLYEKLGSSIKSKVMAVQKRTTDGKSVFIELEDLSNAFTKCGAIAPNTAEPFATATDEEKVTNGFITDNNGMISNDAETIGVNLIY